MSKPFVQDSATLSVSSFTSLLTEVGAPKDPARVRNRLGRTAEGLMKLQEEAREQGFEEGTKAGFEQGRIEGFNSIREEMEGSVAEFRLALDQAAARIEGQMEDWYLGSEQSLAELSVLIAARILGRELALDSDSITQLVREAIREITTADKVRIRVHPFDSPALANEKQLILSANPTVRGVEIVDDPSIQGGARIESDSGAIDATIRTQLELALKAIRGSN